ncbi:hypothetical protein RRG08_047544 [Elysia crispata]|uniref:Uncharacterized protein n=1 Tax=Elysia crispata TaxID=231223 RepID=A0AAE0YP83_9GAST|nr:hypothetical protein RRG08_047544 [Elysia crispata]
MDGCTVTHCIPQLKGWRMPLQNRQSHASVPFDPHSSACRPGARLPDQQELEQLTREARFHLFALIRVSDCGPSEQSKHFSHSQHHSYSPL